MIDSINMSTIELRQLRHVLALSRAGNFRRAADQEYITQPALTKSIQSLEGKLNTKLFIRQSKGVSTTRSGEAVVHYANMIEGQLKEMINSLSDVDGYNQENIVVGIDSHIAQWVLCGAIESIITKCPHIKIHTKMDEPYRLLRCLRNNSIQLVLSTIDGKDRYEGYVRNKLSDQYGVIYARSGHTLTKSNKVMCKDLLRFSFAGERLPKQVASWAFREMAMKKNKLDKISTISCASDLLTNLVIKKTDCWGCAPLNMIKKELNEGSVSVLAVSDFDYTVCPYLVSSSEFESKASFEMILKEIDVAMKSA